MFEKNIFIFDPHTYESKIFWQPDIIRKDRNNNTSTAERKKALPISARAAKKALSRRELRRRRYLGSCR